MIVQSQPYIFLVRGVIKQTDFIIYNTGLTVYYVVLKLLYSMLIVTYIIYILYIALL